jgi:hypothetical protein
MMVVKVVMQPEDGGRRWSMVTRVEGDDDSVNGFARRCWPAARAENGATRRGDDGESFPRLGRR